MLSYPSGMNMSTRALTALADARIAHRPAGGSAGPDWYQPGVEGSPLWCRPPTRDDGMTSR